MCYKKFQDQETPSQYKDVYHELMLVSREYLRSKPKELSPVLRQSLDHPWTDLNENIFPFCKRCEQIVIKLDQKHSDIQNGLKRIRKVMALRRSQRILYELENCRLVKNTDVTTDQESDNQCEQEQTVVIKSSSEDERDTTANSDVQEARERVRCDAGTESITTDDTSDSGTVTEEVIVADGAQETGKNRPWLKKV